MVAHLLANDQMIQIPVIYTKVCVPCVYSVSHVCLTCRSVKSTAKRCICRDTSLRCDLLATCDGSPKFWLKRD